MKTKVGEKMENQEFGVSMENGRIQLSELGKSVLTQVVCFLLAGLSASASSYEYFSPLGIAFCSGIDRKNTLFSCFGAMTGYIISNEYVSAFRYVMALILVYILKVYVNAFPNLRQSTLAMSLISLFSTLSTGLVVMITKDFTFQQVALRVAESVTAFGGAYFISTGVSTLNRINRYDRITAKEVTSLAVAGLMLILTTSRLSLLGVTPSGVACSYVTLVAAYIFKEAGGAILGTGVSLGYTVTGNSLPIVFCYAGAGLFSGIFSYSGRVLCACAYIFSYGAMFVFFGGEVTNIEPLIETAIASLFFVMTPQSMLIKTKTKLSLALHNGTDREFFNMAISRIKSSRYAIGDMSDTLSKVSDILKERSVPDSISVYLRVRDNVCSDCASYDKCWKNYMASTLGEFDCIVEYLRKQGNVTPSVTPMSLQSKCIRIMSLCDSFNKNYSSYSARLGAEGRINEMRKISVDQFDNVGQMLDDLLESFQEGIKPMGEMSLNIKNSLEDMGVYPTVTCYEDAKETFFVNITLNKDCKINDEEILDSIEKVTEKDFSLPVTVADKDEKMLLFWQKPDFSIEHNSFQISSKEGEMCGDYFESFYDGRGNFVAVLSDGMGSGNRAAIDGTMAATVFSKLIISGFSFPCSLRLVNSAMLVKSHEESLATLDILKVNLYNGQSVIYKAGASISLLYRNGKVGEIKKSAMPIGILRQAEFATVKGMLKDEDVIVIMSDGATENSIKEIKEYIAKNGYSDDLSEKLCAVAKSKNLNHSDDITVAVIKIKNGD